MADDPPPSSMVPPEERPPQSFISLLLEVWQDMGKLRGEVGQLNADVDHVAAEQDDAKRSRDRIHEKLDTITTEAVETKATVSRIAPIVDRLDHKDVLNTGAKAAIRRFFTNGWTLATACAGSVVWLIANWRAIIDWIGQVLR